MKLTNFIKTIHSLNTPDTYTTNLLQKKDLESLISKMQNGSTVTLYSVYCLPPIFPGMWRVLEAVSSVNASGVVTYFQVIVEIEHSL